MSPLEFEGTCHLYKRSLLCQVYQTLNMRKSFHILLCLAFFTSKSASGRSDIVECSIDKTWFRVARILLHVRLTQRPLKFHEYAARITSDFKRGCPVLDCPKHRYFPRICRIPTVFKFGGRTCRGCYVNLCTHSSLHALLRSRTSPHEYHNLFKKQSDGNY